MNIELGISVMEWMIEVEKVKDVKTKKPVIC